MIFSFSATTDFDFLTQFARYIQQPIENDVVLIPETLGEGYIRRLTSGEGFKITLHRYGLREDQRPARDNLYQ